VLGAVDEVFAPASIAASVCGDAGGFPPHIALPDAPPGSVEIWEPEKPDDRAPIEGWDAPFDRVSETNPRVKLSQRIARTVRRLVGECEPVGFARAACYGDVLILVRQRGPLFEAIIRALKNENVEVAGADRLALAEHIAVMDLMALGDALLLDEDDLALATVLRSPLFGLSEEDLFALAHGRGRCSLRTALARKAPQSGEFAAAAARLDRLALAARRQTPFTFFAELLGLGGRRRFLARLGAEAGDALDEFLNLALEYERRQTPSLQGFLAWLRDARAEVKRDMEIARDEVRVMTVHGAKGLEAPIVILADTMTSPTGPAAPRLLKLADGALVWAGRKETDGPALTAARQAALAEAQDEYRRLLYVAMTRAADRLIVCGADGVRARPKGCWYNLVHDALAPLLVEEVEFGEKVLRYRKAPADGFVRKAGAAFGETPTPPPALPSWLSAPAAPATPAAAPLSPSAAFDTPSHRLVAASALDRQQALRRGRLVHRLMQSLPDIAPAQRRNAAERYLAKNSVTKSALTTFAAGEQQDIVDKLLAILEDESFAALFAPGSRPEVPIVGRVRRPDAAPVEVSGQVDRLSIGADAVLVADYKTDRFVPARVEEVLGPYVTQLSLYRAVLSQLYPDRPVRAALVFTAEPRLFELPPALLDRALGDALARERATVTVR
jgi:ATP-dependent helicase/nuclease subunit A